MSLPVPKREDSPQERVEIAIKHFLRRFGIDIRRIREPAQSETSQARPRLIDFCQGNGLDLGPGGDPISPRAVRVDLPEPYTKVGTLPVQLGGDATNLYWFTDGCLDYVFSSHLLEDFEDTEKVLREWLRVLKVGGHLVILCPDEQRYRAHCTSTGQGYNYNHVHEDFSLKKVKDILQGLGSTQIIQESDEVGPYSWEVVAKKLH